MKRVCERCGKPLLQSQRSDARFCGPKCRQNFYQFAKRRAAGVDADQVEQACRCCDTVFVTTQHGQLYCGSRCKLHAKYLRGLERESEASTYYPPPPQPWLIAKRAAAIRATWSHETWMSRKEISA